MPAVEPTAPLPSVDRDAWIQRPPQPHIIELEPADETIAELQSAVVQSRACAALTLQQLLDGIDRATRSLASTGDPRFAVAAAAYAIRIREEYP